MSRARDAHHSGVTGPTGSALLLAACDGPAGHGPAPAAAAVATASEHELGRKVYNFRCYFCHGYSGAAKTLAATYLKPLPRDFTRGPALPRAAIAETGSTTKTSVVPNWWARERTD